MPASIEDGSLRVRGDFSDLVGRRTPPPGRPAPERMMGEAQSPPIKNKTAREKRNGLLPKKRHRKKIKKNRWKDPRFLADTANSLARKAVRGHGIPAKSITPFARVPKQYGEQVYGGQGDPVQGWDAAKLNKRERRMLAMLMHAGDKERAAAKREELLVNAEAGRQP